MCMASYLCWHWFSMYVYHVGTVDHMREIAGLLMETQYVQYYITFFSLAGTTQVIASFSLLSPEMLGFDPTIELLVSGLTIA